MDKPRPIQVRAAGASGVEGGARMAGAGGPAAGAGLLVAAPPPAVRGAGAHLPVLVHLRQHALLHPPPPRRRRRRRLPPDRRRVGLGQLSGAANADRGHGRQQPTAPGPAAALPVGPPRVGRRPAAACGLLRAGFLPGPPGPPPGPALRPLPCRAPLLGRRHPAVDSRVRDAAGGPAADAGDGGPAGRGLPGGGRVHRPGLRARPRVRLPSRHGLQQRRGRVAQGVPSVPAAQIHPLHTFVPEPAPPRASRQLLPVHAGAGLAGRDAGRARVVAAASGLRRRAGRRRAGDAGVRVPGARGGHHGVDARAVRAAVAERHPVRQPLLPAPVLAAGLQFHAPHVVQLQDLRRQLLLPPWTAPPDLYFLPAAKKGINQQIELAILRADRMGVKVLSLAALNKNEALNGGGTLFVNKHPDLRVRVVHGNTLTAAVILNEIPSNVKEVFMTGATSKLGRAIALYLCRKKIRVLMFTMSSERFVKIQREAPAEYQQYLVQVTKYTAAQNCKTWIVGKWLSPREQRWAPPGTHFHQFVVPPIIGFRRDCTYGKLAAMRLPKDVQGLGSCEYTMERGVVHACHAGGVVHFLEGWQHHEVGAIDVDRIEVVWNAAIKHGLAPV